MSVYVQKSNDSDQSQTGPSCPCVAMNNVYSIQHANGIENKCAEEVGMGLRGGAVVQEGNLNGGSSWGRTSDEGWVAWRHVQSSRKRTRAWSGLRVGSTQRVVVYSVPTPTVNVFRWRHWILQIHTTLGLGS